MSSDQSPQEATSYIEEVYQQDSLNSIYMSLSVSDKHFDNLHDEQKNINICIEEIFDKDFKLIETKKLESEITLLNTSFVKLIHYCRTKNNYKKVGIIFIEYCDYFDLDYSKTYSALHDKLKILIEKTCKSIIGVEVYEKMKIKQNGGLIITSLFDLIKK
jgi:hypothetical protein